MATLVHAVRILSQAMGDLSNILISQVLAFVILCSHLKRNILLLYPSSHLATEIPAILPRETRTFIGQSISMAPDDVEACWDALKEPIWQPDSILQGVIDGDRLQRTFETHGKSLYPSWHSLWPPTEHCINTDCVYVKNKRPLKLQTVNELEGILWTASRGAKAVRVYQFTCEGCRVVYHPDYYIQKHSETDERIRHYYNSEMAPRVLQVATHHFVETLVVKSWRAHMLNGASSATNCARAYTLTFSRYNSVPSDWTVQPHLRSDYVMDGFKILSLMEYHYSHGSHLAIPQTIDQAHRFDAEMMRVNEEYRTHGQPEINHRCEKCVRTITDEQGQVCEVFAVICDGVTVGRPCCGVPHCRGALASTQDEFCPEHAAKRSICRVIGCEKAVRNPTAYTCSIEEHVATEKLYRDEEKAAFQLKIRHERSRKTGEHDGASWDPVSAGDTASDAAYDAVVETGKGKEKKKTKIRAHFGRRRTHNKQLIVAPCGIILARETFYFSEAFSAVAKLARSTFEGRRKPNHFIYDTNCILSKHVRNPEGDPSTREFFEDIGLAVDVFHFKCKHSEKDTYCGSECNPYSFPELMYKSEDGRDRWYFNTSIAEQTNSWFGRYASMCREMRGVFFEFFLNQMILMHNEDKKKDLESSGFFPTYWCT